jgi:hypothetical protein
MEHFYRTLTIEVAIAVLVVAALLGGIVVFASRVNTSLDDITVARAELVKRWRSLNSLASLITDYNERAKGALAVMEQMVPIQDQIFNLNREFQALAAKGGVTAAFSFIEEKAPADGMLGSVRFTLSVTGELGSLFRFVKSVEQFKYLSAVDSVVVENSGKGSVVDIQGRVFFRK